MIRYLGAFAIVLLLGTTAQAEWRYVARVPVVAAPVPVVVPAPVVVAEPVPYTTYYAPSATYVAPVMPAPVYVAPAPVVYGGWIDVRTRYGLLGPRTVIRAYP